MKGTQSETLEEEEEEEEGVWDLSRTLRRPAWTSRVFDLLKRLHICTTLELPPADHQEEMWSRFMSGASVLEVDGVSSAEGLCVELT